MYFLLKTIVEVLLFIQAIVAYLLVVSILVDALDILRLLSNKFFNAIRNWIVKQ